MKKVLLNPVIEIIIVLLLVINLIQSGTFLPINYGGVSISSMLAEVVYSCMCVVCFNLFLNHFIIKKSNLILFSFSLILVCIYFCNYQKATFFSDYLGLGTEFGNLIALITIHLLFGTFVLILSLAIKKIYSLLPSINIFVEINIKS